MHHPSIPIYSHHPARLADDAGQVYGHCAGAASKIDNVMTARETQLQHRFRSQQLD